jgi:hypothetical protein
LKASLYLVDLYCVSVDCLEVVCKLTLTCLGSHSTVVHQLLTQENVFFILMGRSLLIRDRELESTGIFMGQVDVFSGGLEVEECLSNNGIITGPLLDCVCFGFFYWCSAYIQHICFVAHLLPVSVHLVQRLVF